MITEIKKEHTKALFTHSETAEKEYTLAYFDNILRTCILKDIDTGVSKMASYDNIKISC